MTTSGDEPQVPLQPPTPPYTPPPPANAPMAPPSPYPATAPAQYPPPAYGQNPYGQPFGYAPSAPVHVSGATRLIGWLIVALGLVVVLGAFLPWLTADGYPSVSGIGNDTAGTKDGVFTIPLGLVAVGLGIARGTSAKAGGIHLAAAITALVCGVLVALIGVADWIDIATINPDISAGSGVILTCLAGLALMVAGITGIVKRS